MHRIYGCATEKEQMTGTSQQVPLSSEELRQLADRKENEWREAQHLRIQTLEASVHEKDTKLSEERTKFQKLKDDFKYNLRLLSERDAELDKYDSVYSGLKKQLAIRDGEISELKIRLDDVNMNVKREVESREEHQRHYQQRVREQQAQFDQYRSAKDAELQKERQELESFRRNLERQVRELEEELQIQKRELTTEYEESLRKREHEWRTKADQMSSTVLAHELKVKLLSKELELSRESQQTNADKVMAAGDEVQTLQKKLKQAEWQLRDTTAIKDAKIAELQNNVKELILSARRDKETFELKHAKLDQHTREKETALSKFQLAAREREHELQEAIRDLRSQVDEGEVKLRQAQWDNEDVAKKKQDLIVRLQEEVQSIQSRWDSHVADISRENVARDIELQTLKEMESKWKAELSQRKDDIDRYKRDLAAASEREAALERTKAQLELDWQRRYDSAEREQYEKSEDFIKNLTKARDEALAGLKEKDREISHRTDVTQLLTEERDRALATLKQHALVPDQTIDMSRFGDLPETASDQITELQEQNDHLRQVIRQMRQEMESIGDHFPASSPSGKGTISGKHSAAEEYTRSLENQVKELKAKLRELKQTNQQAGDKELGQGEGQHEKEVKMDNPLMQSHIEQLNNTIGTLRSEKVDLAAQVRKQQAKLIYLQNTVDSLSKQPKEQQLEMEQLRYETDTAARRHAAETESLRQRVADLELQLNQAWKESDTYHKANIQANMENTQLNQQVSQLKIEMAETRPTINFGAQELLIQQLQDEISHLRKLQQGTNTLTGAELGALLTQPSVALDKSGISHGQTATVTQLREKLRVAARHIAQLAKDKQQLIEMGNRLRAQLHKQVHAVSHKDEHVELVPTEKRSDDTEQNELQQRIHTKLQQLEALQYELTKQQLAKGHGKSPPRHAAATARRDVDSTTESEEDDWMPKPILKKTNHSNGAQGDVRPHTADSDIIGTRSKGDSVQHPDIFRPGTSDSQFHHRPDYDMVRPGTADSDKIQRSGQGLGDATPLLMSMGSSIGGESLQEVWKLLDGKGGGFTPRPFTPGEMDAGMNSKRTTELDPGSSMDSGRSFTVRGNKTPLESRPAPQAKPKIDTALKKHPQKQQIRNWNLKDDGMPVR